LLFSEKFCKTATLNLYIRTSYSILQGMYSRILATELLRKLKNFPVVAILGPRQCGKTTFARNHLPDWSYLDLERPSDRRPLEADIEARLRTLGNHCILDEAQRLPEMFPVLRSLIDEERSIKGRWVLLGSASFDLIRDISETLAGRIAFIELPVLLPQEIASTHDQNISETELIADRWFRGGFPEAWLQSDDLARSDWFEAYERTFLQKDVLELGMGVQTSTVGRLWAMMAHGTGGIWNASSFGAALGVNYHTVNHYAELLEGSFLIRRLTPWYANVGKRLTKSPKLLFRDTGLLHHFLGIRDQKTLDVHPSRGHSWESFVVESLITRFSHEYSGCKFGFWRTLAGAEVDLIVERSGKIIPIEVKIHTSPVAFDLRGLAQCIEDLDCEYGIVVHGGTVTYTIGKKIRAIPATEMLLGRVNIDI
jgi:predicted AAA+ superfamily ATPase